MVSFTGQVPVYVVGTVNEGDYIIPSASNDGIGVAVAPEKITYEQFLQSVGVAWESSNDFGLKRVNVAVGNFGKGVLSQGMIINGNVGIGTTTPGNLLTVVQTSATDPIADAWTTYSSRRWKENITPIPDALEKVLRLRGVAFDWKADGKHDLGMIAEEVGEVLPELVAYEDNGVDAKSLDYARLTAVLVEALKELKAENDSLKARLDALENR